MKKITLIMAMLFSIMVGTQNIYKSSIDSGGTSALAGDIQVMYTIGEVNVQESTAGNIILSEGFVGAAFKVLIDPKVYLQGPLLNPVVVGLMNDDLRQQGYLPINTPFSDDATVAGTVFNKGGTSGSGPPQDDIVDWIWVELRAANDNTNLINERSALLQRDGDIVDLDGVSGLVMTAGPTNYYVVVKHRNHLGAMSSSTFGLAEVSTTQVNFKSNGVSTFGSNARVDMGSGNFALWTGDTNNFGQAKFSGASNSTNVIKDYILADPANVLNFITFGSTGYLNEDVDLNGVAKFSGSNNDSNIVKDNVLAHPGNVLNFITYTISETVPAKN